MNAINIPSNSKGLDEDEKSKAAKMIRQERYAGTTQRSFYVGGHITEDDVTAKNLYS